MASRQLKKLRQQQELLRMKETAAGADSDSGDELISLNRRNNTYAGLAALADPGGSTGGEEEEDDAEENLQPGAPALPQQRAVSGMSRKCKKKKRKGKARRDEAGSQDGADEDEIDRVLAELNLAQPEGQRVSIEESAGGNQAMRNMVPPSNLLRINTKHLKAMNEMRRLFGEEIIRAADAEESNGHAPRRRSGLQHVSLETYLGIMPGKKPVVDSIIRNNPFIGGKKTWPGDPPRGLIMKLLPDGEFTFAHEKLYDDLETQFWHLVHMHDPMELVHFLQRHPYHISSLIQISKFAKQNDQNAALAAELCERALFTFGRVTLSEFRKKLEHGRVTMNFSRPENRQFYLAAYNLIKNLIMKGTYRTALEWVKLLLGLDHKDPYGMMNWVHVLAIRAHEAEWFVDLCNSSLFDEALGGIDTALYAKQSLPLAKLQLKDEIGARTVLVEGMNRVPWLYSALFGALGLNAPRSIWAVQARDEEEDLHTQLYIHLAKSLWDSTEAMALLQEAGKAAQKAELASLPAPAKVSLATARFVYLDNTPSLMASVPRQLLHSSPNFDFDPLPPPEADNIFSSETQQRPWRDGMRAELSTLRTVFENAPPGFLNHIGNDGGLGRRLQEITEAGLEPQGVLRRILALFLPHAPAEVGNNNDAHDHLADGNDHQPGLGMAEAREDDESNPVVLEDMAGTPRLLGQQFGPQVMMPGTWQDEYDEEDGDMPDWTMFNAVFGGVYVVDLPPGVPVDSESGSDAGGMPPLIAATENDQPVNATDTNIAGWEDEISDHELPELEPSEG